MPFFVGLLIFAQASASLAESVIQQNKAIGSYIMAPDGKVGTIGTRIHNDRVVISFHNRRARTARSQNFSTSDVQFSQNMALIEGFDHVVRPGDYVSVIRPEHAPEDTRDPWIVAMEAFFEETLPKGTAFMIVEAVFPDKVLLRPLNETHDAKYTPKPEYVFSYGEIQKRLAGENILNQIADQVGDLTQEELVQTQQNLGTYIDCLENNNCNFTVKLRKWVTREPDLFEFSWFGKMNRKRVMEDLQVTSREQYMDLLRQQAVQFKLMTGLANARQLLNLDHSTTEYGYAFVKPLPGLDTVPFKVNGPYIQAVEQLIKYDIGASRDFMGALLRQGGLKEEHPEDLFGDSETCNLSGCQKMNYFTDFVQPLYEVFLFEYAQTQAFLPYLNWMDADLEVADFVKAMRKAQREMGRTHQMIADLKGPDRLFLLSFVTNFERVIDDYELPQQELVRAMMVVESENQNFWRDMVREIRKPQFWGILGCYGVTIFTPLKFMNLICHAAGMAVVSESLITNLHTTQRYYHMQKMQLIPHSTYREAAFGLAVEVVLATVFVKAAAPDFMGVARSGIKAAGGASAAQTALGMQRSVIRNRGIRDIYDHVKQTLQKMMAGLAVTGQAPARALVAQMLGGQTREDMTYQRSADLFMGDFTSMGFTMGMVLDLPLVKDNWDICRNFRLDFTDQEWADLPDDLLQGFAEIAEAQQEVGCIDHAPPLRIIESTTQQLIENLPASGMEY